MDANRDRSDLLTESGRFVEDIDEQITQFEGTAASRREWLRRFLRSVFGSSECDCVRHRFSSTLICPIEPKQGSVVTINWWGGSQPEKRGCLVKFEVTELGPQIITGNIVKLEGPKCIEAEHRGQSLKALHEQARDISFTYTDLMY